MSGELEGRVAEGFQSDINNILEALLSIDVERPDGLSRFSQKLKDGLAMKGLKNFASHIADNGLEKEIRQEELESIQEQINELINTIENTIIDDDDFKKMLIFNLKSLIQSIHEYSFFGVTAINDSLQKITGQVALHPQRHALTKERENIIRLIFEKMRDFNTITSFTNTMHQALPIIVGTVSLMIGKG